VLNQRLPALHSRIRDLAHLFRIEVLPTFVVKFFVEAGGIGAIPKIDESVAQVAAVLEIDRQVEEVVAAAVALVQHGEQHFLAVLVRNVPDHERRAWWGAHIAARLRQVKRVLSTAQRKNMYGWRGWVVWLAHL